MAFANTDSYIANDANNNLRGLNKDNSDNAHTGDTNETDLASFAMAGGTMGATGALHILAGGTTTGTTDTKTARFKFGSVTLSTVSISGGNANDWFFDIWVFNTATGAQRIIVRDYEGTSTLETIDYRAESVDTTASVTIKVTGQMGGATDTITETFFDVFIVQVT